MKCSVREMSSRKTLMVRVIPTEYLTISEPQNQPMDDSELHEIRGSTDFQILEL